jgi:PilZ domain
VGRDHLSGGKSVWRDLRDQIGHAGLALFDRRKSKRFRVFQQATLIDGRGSRRVHILDLSATGLRAHAEKPPQPGQLFTLQFRGTSVIARAIWSAGADFGVEFVTPLDEQALDKNISSGEG